MPSCVDQSLRASTTRTTTERHQYPVGLLVDEHGATRSREQIMARVHAMTEQFQHEHHNDSLSEVVALTARAREASRLCPLSFQTIN